MSMAEKEAREYQTDQMNQGGLAPRGRVGGGRKKLSRVSLQALRGNEMKTKRKTKKIDAPRAWSVESLEFGWLSAADIHEDRKALEEDFETSCNYKIIPVRILREKDFRKLVRKK